jgi:hypothetical protein
VDTAALGTKMTQRKTALVEEMGLSKRDEEEESPSKRKKTSKR